MPVIAGTTGDRVIDISNLRQLTGGVTTFDPAFANTASCRSAISWIDGEEGVLTYRGLPIETLAKERVSFVETAWLLIFGHLPTEAQRDDFRNRLTEYSALHRSMNLHFNAFPPNGHPMAIMSSMINAMSTHDRPRITDEESFTDAAAKLMSKVRTIAAASYKASIGEPAIYPRYDLKYVENFMHMMFSLPYRAYEPDPVAARALNLFFVLHADHGQNCSTSTVRMVGSSGANLFTSCSAGVCALWGDRHGGANVNAVLALQRIRNSGLTPRQYLAKAKDSGERISGFGHRVYRNWDPPSENLPQCRRSAARHHAQTGSAARRCHGAGGSCAGRRLLHRAQAVPQRGLLFRDRFTRARHPAEHVHCHVRYRADGWLDRPLEGGF